MKKRFSRALSLILAVLTILSTALIFPITSSADTEGLYTYTVANGEATITGCNSSIWGDVTVPATLGGYPVTGIGAKAFESRSGILSVTFPDTVTTIGEAAFRYCTGLSSIVIPDGVTKINNTMFWGCSQLKSVTLPDTLVSISYSAFLDCSSMKSITIPDSVTVIGDYAFCYCRSLTSITIPENILSINQSLFEGCTSLTDIVIPGNVTSIAQYAFKDCTKITSIDVPDSVTSIGINAFNGCTALAKITIPDSVNTIDSTAFSGCGSLTIYTANNYTAHTYAVNKSIPVSLISARVTGSCGDTLTWSFFADILRIRGTGEMTDWSISSMPGWQQYSNLIKKIFVSKGVRSIGAYAFKDYYSITDVTLPKGLIEVYSVIT